MFEPHVFPGHMVTCHVLARARLNMQHACHSHMHFESDQGSACWSDEDYVGRISRISRSNVGMTTALRTMQKALGGYKLELAKLT